jgi:predicted membrane channel-forming protein YqfA (hemolysin III family)
LSSLNNVVVWLIAGGAIVSAAAFLATRPRWADAVGRGAGKLFGMASDLAAPETASARWVAGHLDLLRVLGVAVAVVTLMFTARSLTAVLVVVLVLVVYELALMVYATGMPREVEGPRDGSAGQP